MTETFCPLAWQEVNFNLQTRKLQHCCRASYEKFPDEINSKFIDNNDLISQRRKDLLEGVQNPQCNSCWMQESSSGISYRTLHQNTDLENRIRKNPERNYVNKIEIMFDNICDQSCLYCGPDASSIIAKEENVETRLLQHNSNDLDVIISWMEHLQLINKEKIIYVRFTGGEPTANKSWYNFIEQISNTKLVKSRLHFHTVTNNNMKTEVRHKIISTIKNRSKKWTWSLGMSNESTGEISENVRFGSDWKVWQENFEHFITCNEFSTITVAPSPNIFTIKDLPNFMRYVYTTIEKINPNLKWSFNPNWISSPVILDCANLPSSFKTYVSETKSIIKNYNGYNDDIAKWLNHLEGRIGTSSLDMGKLIEYLEYKNKVKNNKLNVKLLLNQIEE